MEKKKETGGKAKKREMVGKEGENAYLVDTYKHLILVADLQEKKKNV